MTWIIPDRLGGVVEHALGDHVAHRVRDVAGVALVVKGSGHPRGQPDLAVDAAQNHRAEIRRQHSAIEIPAHGQAGDGRKAQRDWDIESGTGDLAWLLRSVIGITSII